MQGLQGLQSKVSNEVDLTVLSLIFTMHAGRLYIWSDIQLL